MIAGLFTWVFRLIAGVAARVSPIWLIVSPWLQPVLVVVDWVTTQLAKIKIAVVLNGVAVAAIGAGLAGGGWVIGHEARVSERIRIAKAEKAAADHINADLSIWVQKRRGTIAADDKRLDAIDANLAALLAQVPETQTIAMPVSLPVPVDPPAKPSLFKRRAAHAVVTRGIVRPEPIRRELNKINVSK